ncbi:MAG: hypothetical protein CMO82_13730 [Winogradskyella sp.]|uniref:Exosortase/archaeosortase family protein n=1 Tax=Winogradskyella poriferorum TaxID=307627 RepID=A0ABU7W549_9FLAO|nr:hypothetical protein [Winogradskyella sp.]|tara:strand:+ start:640 stop:1134 length:495 start_codon:yes stop_codon:yes gene_type:complete
MGKLLGKFDFVLILLQCFGLQFVFTGIYRLYVAYNAEEWDALLGKSTNTYQTIIEARLGEFLTNDLYSKLIIAISIIALVLVLNRIYKVGIVNNVVVLILTLIFTRTLFFVSPYFIWKIEYFSQLLGESIKSTFLMSGLFFLVLGLAVIWKSLVLNVTSRQNTQ